MTITISISPATEARLQEQAAANGRDIAEYVTEIVEHAMTPNSDSPAVPLPPDQRATQWRAWAESHAPISHFVDDSRESIYGGRGE